MAKKLYGVYDEDDGEVYAAYESLDEVNGLEYIEMVENFTWEMSDWTDPVTQENYIATDRLAKAFQELCESTGMKKLHLAKICGRDPSTFSRYLAGDNPVPRLVWERVEEFKGR